MPTEVKICGLKTIAALDAALEAGADYVGFVFFAKSPRNISISDAAKLVCRTRERSRAKTVALVVDADDKWLDDLACDLAPDILQLHGEENPDRVSAIVRNVGLPVWKAVSVSTAADVDAARVYLDPADKADLLLFDAKQPRVGGLPGGNGLSFDWRILDSFKGRDRFALAGGLTPVNVAEAIRLTGAAIVDVSSGVESAPGIKDPELIRHFLKAAKAAKQS